MLPEAVVDGLGHDETSGFAKFDGNAYLALLACLFEKKRLAGFHSRAYEIRLDAIDVVEKTNFSLTST